MVKDLSLSAGSLLANAPNPTTWKGRQTKHACFLSGAQICWHIDQTLNNHPQPAGLLRKAPLLLLAQQIRWLAFVLTNEKGKLLMSQVSLV